MEQIKQNAYQLKYILQHSIDAENPEMLKNPESFKKVLQRMSNTALAPLGFYEPYDRKSLYFNSMIDLKYKIPKFILDKITKPNTKKQRTIVQLLEGSRELRDGESMDCECGCRRLKCDKKAKIDAKEITIKEFIYLMNGSVGLY